MLTSQPPRSQPARSAYCSNSWRNNSSSLCSWDSSHQFFSCATGFTCGGRCVSHACNKGCHLERNGRNPRLRTASAIPPTEYGAVPTDGPAYLRTSRVVLNKLCSDNSASRSNPCSSSASNSCSDILVASSTYKDHAALRSVGSDIHSAEPSPNGRLTDTFAFFGRDST